MTEADIQLQLERIRQTSADADKLVAERLKLLAEERWWPRGMIFQAMTATAALLGAGAVIGKLFLK